MFGMTACDFYFTR